MKATPVPAAENISNIFHWSVTGTRSSDGGMAERDLEHDSVTPIPGGVEMTTVKYQIVKRSGLIEKRTMTFKNQEALERWLDEQEDNPYFRGVDHPEPPPKSADPRTRSARS